MKEWLKWVGGALLISFFIIIISRPTKKEEQLRSEVELFYSLQDTIRYLKNKDNSTTAQIKLLEADKKTLAKVLAKTNKSLSDLLKNGSTSGTVINTETVYDTIVNVKVDTINNKPYFLDTVNNRWLTMRIELKDDSLRKSIKLKDSISVSFKTIKEGKGLFNKKKKSVVEVTTHNPYVKVNGVRSFDITAKKNNKGRLFWVGIAVGATGVILLQ